MARGKYLVLEGDEGAGKTTQLELLGQRLSQQGYTPEVVREPGGDPLAEELRQILKYTQHELSDFAEVLIFNAARRNMLEYVVRPILDRGTWCLADRSFVSTLVYQGIARLGLARSEVQAICDLTIKICRPDLIIVLDVPLEISQARQTSRGELADRIESAGDAFRYRVNTGYRDIAQENGYPLVSAVGTEQEVHDRIWTHVIPLLEGAPA
jgi:dTMP kinase